MGSPWNGPRHRSWASDTVIFAVVFLIVLITTVLVDALNGPNQPAPAYLTGLLGAAGAALFGAAGSDKSKREREISDDAATARRRTTSLNEDQIRTEAKVDDLARLAKRQHPDETVPDPFIKKPDDGAVT